MGSQHTACIAQFHCETKQLHPPALHVQGTPWEPQHLEDMHTCRVPCHLCHSLPLDAWEAHATGLHVALHGIVHVHGDHHGDGGEVGAGYAADLCHLKMEA